MDLGCSTGSTTADALHDTTSSTDPSSSRLLTLPWEIRQEILQRALPYSSYAGDIESHGVYWCLRSTNVLRTCRQLHVEGTTVLYSLNSFHLVIWTELPAEYQLEEPFLGFYVWKDCPKCGKEDPICEDCLSDPKLGSPRRQMSPERLGMANIMLVRDWVLEIDINVDYDILQNYYSCLFEAPRAEEIKDLVRQVAKTYLSQVRRLRKLRVLWSLSFHKVAAHPDCVKFREEAIQRLKGLGVPIEEILDPEPEAESDTSGN